MVGTQAPTQKRQQDKSTYQQGQQNQTQALANSIVKRTQAFALSTEVKAALADQGIVDAHFPKVLASCIAANIPPNLMRYSHNIPVVKRVYEHMTRYGFLPGEDFHVAVYTSKQAVLNEFGEPTGSKADAPTIVYMPSAARAFENAKEDARLNGLIIHIETESVDGDEAKEIFDRELGGTKAVWGKDVRVAKASLYKYIKTTGQSLGSGKPEVFYGFYLPHKENGQKDWVEEGKVLANYGPMDIAKKRALVKASRSVTRSNYARDERTVDQRLIALLGQSNRILTEAEQVAREQGVSLEDALYGDIPGEVIEHEEVMHVRDTEDFSTGNQMETASTPEPTVEVFGSPLQQAQEPVTEPVEAQKPAQELSEDEIGAILAHSSKRIPEGPVAAFIEALQGMCVDGAEKANGLVNLALDGLASVTGHTLDDSQQNINRLLLLLLCGLLPGEEPSKAAAQTLIAATVKEHKGRANQAYDEPGNVQARGWIKEVFQALHDELAKRAGLRQAQAPAHGEQSVADVIDAAFSIADEVA